MSQLICKNLLVGYEGKAILDTVTTEIYTISLHDHIPTSSVLGNSLQLQLTRQHMNL